MDSKTLKIILLVCCVGSFILMAACCGGNSWVTVDGYVKGVEVSIYSGLWERCVDPDGGCFDLGSDVVDWAKAVRAFCILAVLAIAASSLLALVALFSAGNIKGIIVSIFSFGAAGCMIISLSIYTNKQDNFKYDNMSPGWSFVLGTLGTVGAVASGVLGILSKYL